MQDTTVRQFLSGTTDSDILRGSSRDDIIIGRAGNDIIDGGTGSDKLYGNGGDDWVRCLNASGLTGLYGQAGNDTLIASVKGTGQVHMSGGEGDDRIVMGLINNTGVQGHHVYGGRGADTFEFRNSDGAKTNVLGRIDDFDFSRDRIIVDGKELDLHDLPNDIRVVSYLGQQWLNIDNKAIYALEGARDGGRERHFSELPDDFAALKTVRFIDQMNVVPEHLFPDDISELNVIRRGSEDTVSGTGGDDWIYDENLNTAMSMGKGMFTDIAAGEIRAGAGNDFVDAGKGDDRVYGEAGNDRIAGGVDRDALFGGDGKDIIFGGSEADRIYGGSDRDNLHGGTGNDRLAGNTGDDNLFGGQGDDLLLGQTGDDDIRAGSGNDRLFGEADDDTLRGDGGDDLIRGGGGRDVMSGGTGNDRIVGGVGRDAAWGNGGADTFVFNGGDITGWDNTRGTLAQRQFNLDRINDFEVGVDRIAFLESTGVDSLSDLNVWKTMIGDDMHYSVQIKGTDERFLVNVDDDVSFSTFMDTDNFLFG